MLAMTPEPVLGPTWQAVVGNHRNVKNLSLEYVEANGASAHRLARRAGPLSAGGDMNAYSSPTGKKLSLPPPASLLEAKTMLGAESSRRSCRDRVYIQIR